MKQKINLINNKYVINKDVDENKEKRVIHFITNYVTANDLANVASILHCSPIMADEPSEMADIGAISHCLAINIGTVNKMQFESIKIACECANKRNIPIVLDPVGVGCSKFRQEVVNYILTHFEIDVIKGNRSEIDYLIYQTNSASGVDSDNVVTELKIDEVQKFCKKHNTVVVITGFNDYVISQNHVHCFEDVVPPANILVGTGCMIGAVIAVMLAQTVDSETDSSSFDENFSCVLSAVWFFNAAKLKAWSKIKPNLKIASYKQLLLDSLGNFNEKDVRKFFNSLQQ